jgi:hypothetical protein
MVLTTLDYALGYARLSWRVFPVWPTEKRPMYKGWQVDATTDEKMVRQYFASDPTRNIGIVCGEAFDAWDIEVEHVPALTAWMDEGDHVLPEAPVAQTGRGGMHILTQPTGVNHTRQLHLNGTHIGELKSTGGFIVVAPSVTDNPYRWTWTPARMCLPEAPEWLRGLLERPKTTVHRFKDRLTKPDDVVAVLGQLGGAVLHAGEGSRNSYLYWAMRRALEEGVPPKHAGNTLAVAGLQAGLDEHEVRATIRSAYDAEGISA